MTSTAKRIVFALGAIGLAAAAAQAEPRMNPRSMTCQAVKAAIRENGAVTLRYTSSRVKNLPVYDRYVANSDLCPQGEAATSSVVPTADNPRCHVNRCERRDYDDNDFLFPPGSRD